MVPDLTISDKSSRTPFGALCHDSLMTLHCWGERLSVSVSGANLLDVKLFCRGVEDLLIEGCALSAGLDSLDTELSNKLAACIDLYRGVADFLAEQADHRVEQLSRHRNWHMCPDHFAPPTQDTIRLFHTAHPTYPPYLPTPSTVCSPPAVSNPSQLSIGLVLWPVSLSA